MPWAGWFATFFEHGFARSQTDLACHKFVFICSLSTVIAESSHEELANPLCFFGLEGPDGTWTRPETKTCLLRAMAVSAPPRNRSFGRWTESSIDKRRKSPIASASYAPFDILRRADL
jgi:hypothetical protein